MPAVASTVYEAVGVRITDLPVTAEKALRAPHEQANHPDTPELALAAKETGR